MEGLFWQHALRKIGIQKISGQQVFLNKSQPRNIDLSQQQPSESRRRAIKFSSSDVSNNRKDKHLSDTVKDASQLGVKLDVAAANVSFAPCKPSTAGGNPMQYLCARPESGVNRQTFEGQQFGVDQRLPRLAKLRAEEQYLIERVRQKRVDNGSSVKSAANLHYLDPGQENLCNNVAASRKDTTSTGHVSSGQTAEEERTNCKRADNGMTLKDFYTCPITMQILEDPVVAEVIPGLAVDVSMLIIWTQFTFCVKFCRTRWRLLFWCHIAWISPL